MLQKSVIHKIGVLIALMLTPSLIVGCTPKKENTPTQNVERDPYYALSTDEKFFYNSIIGSIDAFKDPSSVTFVSGTKEQMIGRYGKISAKNSFGGAVTSTYLFMGNSLRTVEKEPSYYYDAIDTNLSAGKINNALKAYKQKMGWL